MMLIRTIHARYVARSPPAVVADDCGIDTEGDVLRALSVEGI